MSGPIRHVSDIALWVAIYRAFESERPDVLFRDPYARRLAGERGEAIVRSLPRGRSLAWPMIVRTAVMDEIVYRYIEQGVRTVINLAAGLDTRAYRLPLLPSVRWFDVDLPDMMAYRREHLEGVTSLCAHEDLEAELADPGSCAAVLARAQSADGPAMVITKGLLIYLTDEQVSAIARQIYQNRYGSSAQYGWPGCGAG